MFSKEIFMKVNRWAKARCDKFKASGFLLLRFADGTCYRGNFDDGKPNGEGVFTRADGETYEGNFVNGAK